MRKNTTNLSTQAANDLVDELRFTSLLDSKRTEAA